MSGFKVNYWKCSEISQKYKYLIMHMGLTMTAMIPIRVKMNISRQNSRDIAVIRQNLNVCAREIGELHSDLIALRNGIEAVRTETEETDGNVKRMFKPFSFGNFIRRWIDRLKELLDEDNSIVTAANNIVSKLKEWSEQTNNNRVEKSKSEVEPIVIVLNPPSYDPNEIQEITVVDSDDVQPSGGYADVVNNSTIEFNGSNYRLANGVKEEYYYDQNDYDKFISPNSGYNVGCTATAIATACSIKRGTIVDPAEIPWSSDRSNVGVYNYAWDKYTDIVLSMGTYDKNAALMASYEQIKNGNPVLMRLTGNPGHHVTIIGVKENVDPNNLSMSDFIIVDPADGTVKNLDYSSKRDIDTSWSLRIPK